MGGKIFWSQKKKNFYLRNARRFSIVRTVVMRLLSIIKFRRGVTSNEFEVLKFLAF